MLFFSMSLLESAIAKSLTDDAMLALDTARLIASKTEGSDS